MFKILWFVLALSNFYAICYGARILAVFPSPHISHQSVFRPLTRELAKRGHEVVVITTDPAPKNNLPANLREIDIHDISYELRNNSPMTITGRAGDLLEQIEKYYEMFRKLIEVQINTPEVQKLINDKDQYFDIIFTEACARPALVFSHIFKAPVITISSLGSVEMFTKYLGVPIHPILYPNSLQQRLHNLTLWDKANIVYTYYQLDRIEVRNEAKENEMLMKMFGEDVPPLSELTNNVAMLMINVHHIWEGNRPIPPNVVYLGGLHLETNHSKELSNELKSYLDSSKNGIIYVSFGSIVMPSLLNNINILIKAFSKLPYDILLKWDENILHGCPNNVKVVKWVPQKELLHHPNIKLFITQGGMQSTDEAISAGVPVIGIPMLADQWYNVEKYVHFGIGVKINFDTVTEKDILDAVHAVVEDKRYKLNVIGLRKLMYDQPETSLHRAVWWTEYIIRHGRSPHLRPPAARMTLWEFFEIDLLLVLSCILVLIFTTAYLGFKICVILKRNSASIKLKIR